MLDVLKPPKGNGKKRTIGDPMRSGAAIAVVGGRYGSCQKKKKKKSRCPDHDFFFFVLKKKVHL